MKYSPLAITGLAYLFRPYNDFDVYIEDAAGRNMWEMLINRILDRKAKVTKVFQLGGRDEVINECKRYNKSLKKSRKQKAIFIIDGDFDILLNRRYKRIPNLYKLNAYCIETLLFCSDAIIEISFDSMPNKAREVILEQILLKEYVEDLLDKLKPLFITYGVARKLDKDIQTTGCHISNFYDQTQAPFFLSAPHIELKIQEIESTLARTNPATEIRELKEKVSRNAPNGKGFLRVISGKTYLLPYLHVYLRKNVGYKGTLDQLKVSLARHCKLDHDPGLPRFIRKASKI